ncbi:hypothetical protein ASPZODRAFT_1231259 [Penicilliopsis zonata CBS 506.65]|uniref:Zn(2)-C6 fungal-type domain-containing protein n=1 Tax=Penicilliopsis zonata CBS 506.65 TaxID=1073090 RepID=A0A1L9S7N1_9EURO|nr:hypothetical protein ASPZODRAFT_1231259 [Penicilliopsis zonata CBS 506.65]OJJ43178.1 hypothetical protein ASPZODRAFT_1231259 [Penicilliopsis zonata CBS 506.65]
MSDSSSPRSKREAKKRTRTGCLTCRARKIKCDETPGRCANCTRVMLECRWPVMRAVVQRGGGRPRTAACTGCRVARCRYKTDMTEVVEHVENTAEEEIDRDILLPHLDAFFTSVYPVQGNAFIHRGTLLRDINARRADRALLLAICAIATRFLPTAVPGRECGWAREAKALLILEGTVSVQRVATALILAKHDIHCGRFSSAWMLAAMATRGALALGLQKQEEEEEKTFIERETKRRLFWACYCLDRMMAPGLPDQILIRADLADSIALPCEEHSFLLAISPPRAGLLCSDDGEVGLFGHYVRMMSIRYEILQTTRGGSNASRNVPWMSSAFQECERKMTAWKASLPPQCQLRPDTIYARQAQHQLTPLTMLHVWYEQCMADLYRVVLPGFPETMAAEVLSSAPPDWVHGHQLACVEHARSIARTLQTVSQHVDLAASPFLDGSLPMCVLESMRVQLQWFFMNGQADAAALREQVDLLLGYLQPMARYFRQAQWLVSSFSSFFSSSLLLFFFLILL